jgi:uncharacterized protein
LTMSKNFRARVNKADAGSLAAFAPFRMTRSARLLLSLLIALLAGLTASTTAAAAPTYPALTGRVVDGANILPPALMTALTTKLEALEKQTSRQLVIVTLPSLQGLPIDDYGYQLGRAWGIGEKGRNTGVLMIVAPAERRVRIEVGYGLEGVLTDALSTIILQEKVLPKFRAGDPAGGVADGADALIAQLSLPDDQARARVADVGKLGSRSGSTFPFVLVGLLGLWVVFGTIGMFRGRPGHRMDFWFLPLMILMSGGGMGGGMRGHGRGGGGGGGFRGGGGSFGGGGASGGW